jgi:hypothetical protein
MHSHGSSAAKSAATASNARQVSGATGGGGASLGMGVNVVWQAHQELFFIRVNLYPSVVKLFRLLTSLRTKCCDPAGGGYKPSFLKRVFIC